MKITLSEREEWFLEALVEQYIYGETRADVMREGLRLLVGKAQDDGRLPRPVPQGARPSNVRSEEGK